MMLLVLLVECLFACSRTHSNGSSQVFVGMRKSEGSVQSDRDASASIWIRKADVRPCVQSCERKIILLSNDVQLKEKKGKEGQALLSRLRDALQPTEAMRELYVSVRSRRQNHVRATRSRSTHSQITWVRR